MGLKEIVYYINIFFFFYMFLYAIIYFVTSLYSTFQLDDFSKLKEYKGESVLRNDENYIPISILVPAYNEEVTIVDSIESLLSLDYPTFEIVIVNDGSSDETSKKLIDHYRLEEIYKPYLKRVESNEALVVYENNSGVKITLAEKVNGGKSDALNLAINLSEYPLFLCVDADSMLEEDALKRIVEPFLEEDKTVAVGGNIRVSNGMTIEDGAIKAVEKPRNPIVLFQIIEYLRVFLNSRVALDGINGNLIISGPLGSMTSRQS